LTTAGARCTNAVDTTVSQFCQYHALQQANTLKKGSTLGSRGGSGSSNVGGSLLGPRSQAATTGGVGPTAAGKMLLVVAYTVEHGVHVAI
jgi:hypothetical protein